VFHQAIGVRPVPGSPRAGFRCVLIFPPLRFQEVLRNKAVNSMILKRAEFLEMLNLRSLLRCTVTWLQNDDQR